MEKNNSTGQDGICPHCHVKVDWLVFMEDRAISGEFRNGIHYEVDSWPIEESGTTYACPNCDNLLFRDEREASAFLGREEHCRRNAQLRCFDAKPGSTSAKDQKLAIE